MNSKIFIAFVVVIAISSISNETLHGDIAGVLIDVMSILVFTALYAGDHRGE